MRNPVNADYQCPFINSKCVKRSQRIAGPYPVCSLYKWVGRGKENSPGPLICVCPKRFFEADIQDDIIKHCWPWQPPSRPVVAYEVKMQKIGMVDFVIADLSPNSREVRNFVSVELQAVDITGSVEKAYQAILNSKMLMKKPQYGFNYANVYKRYMTQLIAKGYFHHHWKSKIVAVLQEETYEDIRRRIEFSETSLSEANIVFALYRFEDAPSKGAHHKRLVFSRAVGTQHSNLMMGIMYRTPPSRDEFCAKILAQINKG